MTNNAENWPLYQGTKQLKATPMNKSSYCALRGWTVPADEDPAEKGYVVEYQDGGKPNVEGFEGYVSWSPATVFEQTYHSCGTHIERMRFEQTELYERLAKLTYFIADYSGPFPDLLPVERNLLVAQRDTMKAYHTILTTRCSLAEASLAEASRDDLGVSKAHPVGFDSPEESVEEATSGFVSGEPRVGIGGSGAD